MENKQKINYQKQLDRIISKLTDRPRLALAQLLRPVQQLCHGISVQIF